MQRLEPADVGSRRKRHDGERRQSAPCRAGVGECRCVTFYIAFTVGRRDTLAKRSAAWRLRLIVPAAQVSCAVVYNQPAVVQPVVHTKHEYVRNRPTERPTPRQLRARAALAKSSSNRQTDRKTHQISGGRPSRNGDCSIAAHTRCQEPRAAGDQASVSAEVFLPRSSWYEYHPSTPSRTGRTRGYSHQRD